MGSPVAQRVAAAVRAELARQRKSQRQLAGALQLSPQAVSRRLLGEIPFDVDEITRVADWLGVDLVTLGLVVAA